MSKFSAQKDSNLSIIKEEDEIKQTINVMKADSNVGVNYMSKTGDTLHWLHSNPVNNVSDIITNHVPINPLFENEPLINILKVESNVCFNGMSKTINSIHLIQSNLVKNISSNIVTKNHLPNTHNLSVAHHVGKN